MIESVGKLIALAISILTIRQLSLQNSKTELEIKTKARNQKVKRGGLNPSTFPILYHKYMKILNYLLIISITIILLLLIKLTYNKRKKLN